MSSDAKIYFNKIIRDIAKEEQSMLLYEDKVLNVPLWRIFRFAFLKRYLSNNYGFATNSLYTKKANKSKLLMSFLKSFISFFKIIFLRKKFKILIFAFPRLQKSNDVYFDKFTDPIIQLMEEKEKYTIFQRHLSGNHLEPRVNSDKVVKTDFIEVLSKLFGLVLLPVIMLLNYFVLKRLYRKVKGRFELCSKDFIRMAIGLGEFYVSYCIYSFVVKVMGIKSVFLVDREIYYPVIAACKRNKVKIYELQHGVTHSWTLLYSGKYDENIDPDYFLTFGENWIGKQFGLPIEKLRNIGWAYSEIMKINLSETLDEKTILVVSEPSYSKQIVIALIEIIKVDSEIRFEIRLHPQEKYDDEIVNLITQHDRIKVVDNSEESTLSLRKYTNVVGVNSSVLYEALSLKKRVACINFGGCVCDMSEIYDPNPFFILNKVEDFKDFYISRSGKNIGETFYSSFDVDKFNKLLC
jgi:hypothetical protein